MQKMEEFNELWVAANVDVNFQRLYKGRLQKEPIFPIFSNMSGVRDLKRLAMLIVKEENDNDDDDDDDDGCDGGGSIGIHLSLV